jgi:hypothetical protein
MRLCRTAKAVYHVVTRPLLVMLCIVSMPILATADDRAEVSIGSGVLYIPRTFIYNTYIDNGTGSRSIALRVPPKILGVHLPPVNGRNREAIFISIKSDDRESKISSYNAQILGQVPRESEGYFIYKIGVGEELYVSKSAKTPMILICNQVFGGVLSGTPTICKSIQEVAISSESPLVGRHSLTVEYGFLLSDIGVITDMNSGISRLIASFTHP